MTLTETIEIIRVITLIVVIIFSLILCIITLIGIRKKGFNRKHVVNFVLILGLLFITYTAFTVREIQPADWAQIMLMLGLVAVTGFYALSTSRQADASVKMAEEMREQLLVMNKPNIVLELIKITPEKHLIGRIVNDSGRGPAINTEIYIDHPPFKFNKVRYTWAISVRDEKGFDFHMEEPSTEVDPKIAISSTGVLVANYEDVSGNQWHSTLELQWDEGFIPGHIKVGISGHYKEKPK